MNTQLTMQAIAKIHTDFPQKFGIPRQSGLVRSLKGLIIFEPAFRMREAFRGIEGYSHLWLVWFFSENAKAGWTPTVRPPRLGGNVRMGVFATRSPFRPNGIGLSCVRLEKAEQHPDLGTVLHVSGADLMDGTPILDVKPYVPYADCHPDATGGFASAPPSILQVYIPENFRHVLSTDRYEALKEVLSQDPRPAYQAAQQREYAFEFAGYTVRFQVCGDLLSVLDIIPEKSTDPHSS